ncbi:MAG: hypothetical protein Fues2KO_14270 [Fuerstiella sp.]
MSIELIDGIAVYSTEPEGRTIARLDGREVCDVWPRNPCLQLANAFQSFDKLTTFGDLRKRIKGPQHLDNLPRSVRSLLKYRLSAKILCDCGFAYMLHRSHVTCERPGCVAFHRLPVGRVENLRRAFPDQISHVKGE